MSWKLIGVTMETNKAGKGTNSDQTVTAVIITELPPPLRIGFQIL